MRLAIRGAHTPRAVVAVDHHGLEGVVGDSGLLLDFVELALERSDALEHLVDAFDDQLPIGAMHEGPSSCRGAGPNRRPIGTLLARCSDNIETSMDTLSKTFERCPG